MTTLHSRPASLAELARRIDVPGRASDGLVLAATDDGRDPRYAAVRHVAMDLAAATDSCLLLFDRSSSSQSAAMESQPGRTVFPGLVGATGRGRLPLLTSSLDGPRRRHVRDQVAEAERRGIPAIVWLASGGGSRDLAEAVARTRADLVLLPADEPRPRLVGRVIRRTLEYYARRIDAPVVAVDRDETTWLVEPLGGREPARPEMRSVHGVLLAGLRR